MFIYHETYIRSEIKIITTNSYKYVYARKSDIRSIYIYNIWPRTDTYIPENYKYYQNSVYIPRLRRGLRLPNLNVKSIHILHKRNKMFCLFIRTK